NHKLRPTRTPTLVPLLMSRPLRLLWDLLPSALPPPILSPNLSLTLMSVGRLRLRRQFPCLVHPLAGRLVVKAPFGLPFHRLLATQLPPLPPLARRLEVKAPPQLPLPLVNPVTVIRLVCLRLRPPVSSLTTHHLRTERVRTTLTITSRWRPRR
ncbi:hypothetical protein H0H93_004450, partial [Arthromyces matolae]